MLLSIETSCDETALALFDIERFQGTFSPSQLLAEVVSSQVRLHEPFGGVVPELAAREHMRNLPPLVRELFSRAGRPVSSVKAVAATRGPGLKGSLLVGFSFAKAFAYARGVPFIPVNHLEGHLWAGEMNDSGLKIEYPALALIVSGGHTQLVEVKGFRDYKTIARTRDDAAGEAFDKIATLLDLPYPGGPALSRCAQEGNAERYALPTGVTGDDASFSFSGLKTAAMRLIQKLSPLNEETKRDIAASAEAAIVSALTQKTLSAVRRVGPKSVVLTGGVAANTRLRSTLKNELAARGIPLLMPPMKWCTDNAAMIGLVALKQHYERVSVPPAAALSVLSRFPLDESGTAL